MGVRQAGARCCLAMAIVLTVSAFVLVQERATLITGAPAPPFPADVFAQPGRVFDLGESRGGVVVLDFWATWCSPGVASIPHWNSLVDTFAGSRVTFVAVTDDDEDRLTQFLKTKPIKGIVVRDKTG